jgi:hypothetical protein
MAKLSILLAAFSKNARIVKHDSDLQISPDNVFFVCELYPRDLLYLGGL